MLQLTNGTINEVSTTAMLGEMTTGGTGLTGAGEYQISPWTWQTYWYSYPVYVCADKTKKAIEILKALQAEKILRCDSVPRFIALVDKISALL